MEKNKILGSLNDKLNFIKNVSIFSETSEDVLKEIASDCKFIQFNKSETIFQKGDDPNGVYFIYEGTVQIHDVDYVFTDLHTHDFFGEYSLIDSDVRSASVTAITDTTLLKLGHEHLHRFLYSNENITRGLLISLIKRLRENNELEETLVLRNEKIQKQAEKLKEQRKELRELNAMKDKFIAVMAHDLRNPLSTILGLVDILKENLDSIPKTKLSEYLGQVKKYSLSTLELLGDLLQWAKSQSGLLTFKKSRVNISQLTAENVKLFKLQAKTKQIKLINQVNSAIYIEANTNMISTVIRNLLSNAIKFTPIKGEIKIMAVKHKSKIEIIVADTGMGISQGDQNKLFKIEEDVSQVGASAKQKLTDQKSSGLGLILCQEFINKHKGKIWVESDVAKGCKMHFTLPLLK